MGLRDDGSIGGLLRLLPAGLHRRPHVQLHRHPVPAGGGGLGPAVGHRLWPRLWQQHRVWLVRRRGVRPHAAPPRHPRRASPVSGGPGLPVVGTQRRGRADPRGLGADRRLLRRPRLVLRRPCAPDHAGADGAPAGTTPGHHHLQPAGAGGLWPGAPADRRGAQPRWMGCGHGPVGSRFCAGIHPHCQSAHASQRHAQR